MATLPPSASEHERCAHVTTAHTTRHQGSTIVGAMTSPLAFDADHARQADRLRILLVVEGFYPSTGGAELQVRTLSRALLALGHDVRILAPRLDRAKPLVESIDGVEVVRIPYPKIKRIGALILYFRFARQLIVERGRVDAIHVHAAKHLAAIAGALRPWLRATLAVKISGAWEFDGGILDPALRNRIPYRWLNRWIARADTIQCVSTYTLERLREAGYPPTRLRLLPNAVDLTRFAPVQSPRVDGSSPPSHASTARVVFVGRLVPVKALPVLIEAWRGVAARHPHAELVIAGDGPQRAALEAQVRASALEERVRFLGEVRDVAAVLGSAAVYVQPSYTEGLSNAVLEAMAVGLPVVASRISGNEDLIRDDDNGLLVPAGDAPALARALNTLLDDPARAAQMGLRARQQIEQRYSVPAVVTQLLDAYRGARGVAAQERVA